MTISNRREIGRWVTLFAILMVSTGLGAQKPSTRQTTCVTEECHVEYGRKAHVHDPVRLGDCRACHDSIDPNAHTWRLARQGKDLCEYTCHLDQTAKPNVHEPLKQGDCLQCHNPHSSDARYLIDTETVAALCQQCHRVAEGAKALHGPVAAGECSICHNAHSSDYKNLLAMEPSGLCVSCHVVTKDELEKFEFVHEAARGQCAACHDPHGGEDLRMLKGNAPEMCYPCHEDIKTVAETSKYKHGVVRGEDGCLKCHTPHASTVRSLLKDSPITLCMSCHDKPVGIGTDEVLGAFTAEVENMKFLHGPVSEGDCSGCHVTHGSEYFRLLAKDYPPQFYAPFAEKNYDLCFSCHPESLVQTARTTELTDFRNGDVNLHFLHVNKERRGRTCRACHQTHASNLPKHMRESVPYGSWNLPIGFTKTGTGGSCKPGCHVPFDYDRATPLDYARQKTVDARKGGS